MKKFVLLLILVPFVTLSLFFTARYGKNQKTQVPYPYYFKKDSYSKIEVDAPILIIGDRLGKRLASFSKFMADIVSAQLSKPIKIATLATDEEGLHRTLQKVKALTKPPLVTIYLGGSEEAVEQRFLTKDISKILSNFDLYSDDRIKTLLMIFPTLSRILYEPVDYMIFNKKIERESNKYSDMIIQKRNIIHFKIYEEEIEELFSFLKDHNSYVIALTRPFNLDIPPRKNCSGSIDEFTENKLKEVIELIKTKDFKSAYNLSKELVLTANSSAKILFIHGKIAKSLGKLKEAIKFLKLSHAFDCDQWRGNPVYNRIMRKVAKRNDVQVYDFEKLLDENWTKNVLFEDEIYPQSFYFEKVAEVLAGRIKKLLKL